MTALEQLNAYLRRLELRFRFFAASRGAALVSGLGLALTLLFVWIGNRYEFAEYVFFPIRLLLFISLGVAVSVLIAIPLLKLNRDKATRLAEQRVAGFEQRLLTVTEQREKPNAFTELLAEDTLRVARENSPEKVSPTRPLLALAGSSIAACAVLLWLIGAGPGYWGYGASLLWTGSGNPGKRPLYDIGVEPGNKTIRRKSDQLISARLFGFSAHRVLLHAKYRNALRWEETAMQPAADGDRYQFLFAGLSDPVEYYVSADAAQSKHFTINVKDLPGVKRIRVALHYPSALRLQDVVEDPGGDVRAVEGTQADISILTDRHLDRGVLALESGSKIPLAQSDGNWLTARLPVSKDGSYHVAAIDGGELVRISDDYFIEAKKDEPPSVKFLRPSHDPHVSPIEELPVEVQAADDFAVEGMELHYSVNGGPEQTVQLLKTKGAKEAQGRTMLYLENFKLVPGDIVSLYGTARDANTTTRTEMIFAQAEPFDFKFTQSQQMGGAMGMGMGNQDTNISQRQKQIIAATFNEMRDSAKSRAALQEDARFLSDLEDKLGEQAKTLADRMASRELSAESSQFANFSKLMTEASSEMNDAVGELKPGKWHDALSPEQKALQSLLRAEALFRDIQIAFGQAGGGGMNSGAQRDLARMFDLELDMSKNQYETGQQPQASDSDQQKAIDEAFERLRMLAQRQQELAQNAQQKSFEQRWEEEQLRREAEELRREMQQLSQNSQGQQTASSSQTGQQSASSGGRQNGSQMTGRSAQQDQAGRQTAEALRQSIEALQRAEDEMRKAVTDHDATAQQRAAAELRQAQQMLDQMLGREAGDSVSDLARRAESIANSQREIAQRMQQLYSQSNAMRRFGEQSPESATGEGSMPEMNDPHSFGYGYGFRRRNWLAPPSRPASDQEKALASEKEKLAQGVEQLEKQIQQQAQNMAGSQPETSSKLRHALSEAEQKELALRMQKQAEWMREGYGDRNAGMEDSVTTGLDQLSRQLRDVENAIRNGNRADQNGRNDKAAEALAGVRELRERLAQQGQQNAESGGQAGEAPRGEWNGSYDPIVGGGGALNPREIRDAISELNTLRDQVDRRDRALYGYIDGALWNLRHLTGAQPGLLDSRIKGEAMASLERLEVELNKRVAQRQAQGARTGAPEPAPEKYRDAVAEYFKKLSKD